MSALTPAQLDAQEEVFASAFAAGDVGLARALYRPDVVYVSPTTRLYGWPARVEGVDRTLEFIQLTISGAAAIDYAVEERAVLPGSGAFVKVRFDFDMERARLRSTYVVLYRYADGGIARQELFYDPGGALERLGPAGADEGRRGAGADAPGPAGAPRAGTDGP